MYQIYFRHGDKIGEFSLDRPYNWSLSFANTALLKNQTRSRFGLFSKKFVYLKLFPIVIAVLFFNLS